MVYGIALTKGIHCKVSLAGTILIVPFPSISTREPFYSAFVNSITASVIAFSTKIVSTL